METVLCVSNACKRFAGNPPALALDGAELSLKRGEWLALLGPNGAGKTTIIRAIAGRVRLDSGEIHILGRSIRGSEEAADRQARQELGIVPQDLALYPLLTARENMLAFGALHGVPKRELHDRVQWALEWTGLGDRDSMLCRNYSGGMKRRLNIACGILHRPKVVLLDEPTVGVDPQSRERIWSMLAELRNAGASLLLTTHQLDEAQQICDRITIIDHGRTIADGTIDQLVAKTIGRGRRVSIALGQPVERVPYGVTLSKDRRNAAAVIDDVARDLPALLQQFASNGAMIEDVHIERPSLHAVFIALTGRELRE